MQAWSPVPQETLALPGPPSGTPFHFNILVQIQHKLWKAPSHLTSRFPLVCGIEAPAKDLGNSKSRDGLRECWAAKAI